MALPFACFLRETFGFTSEIKDCWHDKGKITIESNDGFSISSEQLEELIKRLDEFDIRIGIQVQVKQNKIILEIRKPDEPDPMWEEFFSE